MFAAGRILRQNRRLSSLPAGSLVPPAARQRPKEKRKFRCYLPFMWSALGMSFLGISIIVTGTAMCVAGWYLGHFADYDRRPEVIRVTSSNASGGLSEGGTPTVEEISESILPARGLAYAGPVVMSFGCFAVVFACVVVCETRDRILETMETRVRRGLPARPPGGIDADFYSLVVEFRKRRAEKQRRRRKLIQRDADDDDVISAAAGRPSTPLMTSPDLQTPSTINFFVEDHSGDQFDDDQGPSDQTSELLGDRTRSVESEASTTRWCLNLPLSDHLRSTSADVELRSMETQSVPDDEVLGADNMAAGSSHRSSLSGTISGREASSLSASNVDVSGTTGPLPQSGRTSLEVPQFVDRMPSCSAHAQAAFPLLAPITSLSDVPSLPYVRLEPAAAAVQTSTPTTCFVHTASVHAIADRSPDVAALTSSFEFPSTVVDATSDRRNSGRVELGENPEPHPAIRLRDSSSVEVSPLEDVNFPYGRDAESATSGSGRTARNSGTAALLRAEVAESCRVTDSISSSFEHAVGQEQPQSADPARSESSPPSAPTDAGYQSKRRPWSRADNTLQVPPPSSDVDKYLEQTLSPTSPPLTVSDDSGPSRKRSRGSNVPGCAQLSRGGAQHPSPSPLLLSPAPYLIAAETWSARPTGGGFSVAAAAARRRRSPNALAAHQRRRQRARPDRDRTSGPQTADAADSDDDQPGREMFSVAQRCADELDNLLANDSSSNATSDVNLSPLVWLRRRTSPAATGTTSTVTQAANQRLTAPDTFQSTV